MTSFSPLLSPWSVLIVCLDCLECSAEESPTLLSSTVVLAALQCCVTLVTRGELCERETTRATHHTFGLKSTLRALIGWNTTTNICIVKILKFSGENGFKLVRTLIYL